MRTMDLEHQIEEMRSKMYASYKDGSDYDEVLELSQELDHLLNELKEFKTPAYR